MVLEIFVLKWLLNVFEWFIGTGTISFIRRAHYAWKNSKIFIFRFEAEEKHEDFLLLLPVVAI